MKTEQEQIEEMIKILLEASEKCLDTDCNYCDYQYKKDCAQYRKAVTLVKAGYGDVKQAKIDVLNFLKDGYEDDISTSNDCDMVVRVDDIDKLIKEIEEQ